MKDSYEKIFLGVGALLVAGAAAFYFMGGGAGADAEKGNMADNPYQPLELALQPETQSEWNKPDPWQRSVEAEWEVFTPPEIYYDPNTQQFSFVTPRPRASIEWCLELVSIVRPLFRVQYEGFVIGGRGAKDYIVLMTNPQTGAGLQGRAGDIFDAPDQQFTITSFEVTSKVENGIVIKDTVLKLRDNRSQKEIAFVNDEKIFADGFTVNMFNKCDNEEFEWQEVGQTITISQSGGVESVYTLKDIRLDENAVLIEQVHPDLATPKQLALLPTSVNNSSETETEPETAPATPASGLEFQF